MWLLSIVGWLFLSTVGLAAPLPVDNTVLPVLLNWFLFCVLISCFWGVTIIPKVNFIALTGDSDASSSVSYDTKLPTTHVLVDFPVLFQF